MSAAKWPDTGRTPSRGAFEGLVPAVGSLLLLLLEERKGETKGGIALGTSASSSEQKHQSAWGVVSPLRGWARVHPLSASQKETLLATD